MLAYRLAIVVQDVSPVELTLMFAAILIAAKLELVLRVIITPQGCPIGAIQLELKRISAATAFENFVR